MAYNKDQWRQSFEGQLSILRQHLSPRLLSTMSLTAWNLRGTNGQDPIEAAREESKALDAAKKK